MKKKLITIFFLILITLILTQCRVSRESGEENPIPRLSTISPDAMVARMPSFTFTAGGANFVSGSKIVFNGIEKETGFVNSETLTCQIEPGDIIFTGPNPGPGQAAGMRSVSISYVLDQTVSVEVRNPSPGGGGSNSLNFTIKANPGFKEPRPISPDGLTVNYFNAPSLTIDGGGKINAVWESLPYADNEPGIYFNYATDKGDSWSDPVKIYKNTSPYVGRAVVAIDGSGNMGVVWNDFPATANPDILFSGSQDNGDTWSVPVNISNTGGFSENPAIAMDSAGNIYVVWEDYDFDLDKPVIFFSRSLNNGISWSAPAAMALELPVPKNPDITVDEPGNVYIACTNSPSPADGVYFLRSENNGGTWSQPVRACLTGTINPVGIAVNNSGHIVILGSGSRDVFVVCSADGGQNWTGPLSLFREQGNTWSPTIAVDGIGNFCVVWSYFGSGKTDIYFTRSIDNGTAWSTPLNVSNIENGSIMMADIAADNQGNIGIAWVYLNEDINKWQIDFTSTTP